MNFISIDFETANKKRSSICSIGIATVENGKIIEKKHILVKPYPNYYDPSLVQIHGINYEDTESCKSFDQQWRKLRKYFHNKTVVAHNASFDLSALRAALDSYNLNYPNLKYHCTLALCREILELDANRLCDIADYYKIKLNHHNAESDAIACAKIALKLIRKNRKKSLEELSHSLGFGMGKFFPKERSYQPFSKKSFIQ
jgi:DNA polymerase-3 subunit epsilon